jgi:hypothetical protein
MRNGSELSATLDFLSGALSRKNAAGANRAHRADYAADVNRHVLLTSISCVHSILVSETATPVHGFVMWRQRLSKRGLTSGDVASPASVKAPAENTFAPAFS